MEGDGMKETRFTIGIHASRERVWATLWEDRTFRDWANLIDEGTFMTGAMEEGGEIRFISSVNGYGVTSRIERLRLNEFVSFRHSADTMDGGRQEREKEWTGGTESYSLDEREGVTTLTVVVEIPQEMEEIFHIRLPLALERIRDLSENGPARVM